MLWRTKSQHDVFLLIVQKSQIGAYKAKKNVMSRRRARFPHKGDTMSAQRYRWFVGFVALAILFSATLAHAEEKEALSTSQERRLRNISQRITALELRLRNLSSRSERLSEKIFKKNFSFGAPRLRVIYEDRLGCTFRINEATMLLNGKEILKHDIKTQPAIRGRKIVFDQNVKEGQQRISASYYIQGYGCGVFTYMKKYKLRVRKPIVVPVQKGQLVVVVIAPIDKGGEMESRVDVKIEVSNSPNTTKP